MPENSEGAIKKGKSRETGDTGQKRRRKPKLKDNPTCTGHQHTQANSFHDNI